MMNADRLEELAKFAKMLGEPLQFAGFTDAASRYFDLGRCAAAWAKVDRILRDHTGSSIDFVWTPERGVLMLSFDLPVRALTPIEAIELAKEGKQ